MVEIDQDILDFVAGDSCDIEIEVNKAGGTDENLTGATVDWYLKESETSVAYVIHLTTPTKVELTDPTHGICVVHLAPADTASIAPGKYFHGVKVTLASTNVYTVTTGYFVIHAKLA